MAAAEVTRAAVYRVLEWVATEQFAAEATSMVIRSALTQVEAEQHASELIGRLIHHALVAEATATAAPARETSEEGVHEIDSCTVRHRGRAGKKRRGGWRGLLCCSSPSLAEDIVLQ